MQTHDIIIIGSGISGLATARALAQYAPGLAARTLLIDQRGEAGDAQTETLNTQALLLLEQLGFVIDAVPATELKRVRFRYGEQQREVFFDRPWLAVPYPALHSYLFGQLEQEMEVRSDTIESITLEGSFVIVEGAQSTFRANLVVGADGAGSLVRDAVIERAAQPSISSSTSLIRAAVPDGVRVTADVLTFSEDLHTNACLEYDFSPIARGHAGYAWTLPTQMGSEDALQVGFYEENPSYASQESIDYLRHHAERIVHDANLGDPTPHRLHYYHPDRPISAPQLMLVGEAAGLSPFLGDGLEQCLEYGPLAADLILHAFESGDYSLEGYGDALRKSRLGKQMITARKLTDNLFGRDWEFWLSLLLRRPGVCEVLTKQVSGTSSIHEHRIYMTASRVLHRLLGDTSLPPVNETPPGDETPE